MRINVENSVAIIVDYQEKLVPVMKDGEQVIRNGAILIQGLRELEVPIYVTQQYTKGLGDTVVSIKEALGTLQGEMTTHIEKIRFSAFEDIKECITGKKYVIVCGIEAHICVLQTVIDLAAAGYIPILVVDCISSRKEVDMEYAIERAKREGAVLTTYEAILFELLEIAGTKQSKKIQKLIR